MPCTTNQDCPSDTVCCDGSNESCDGTRLPSGDGANPGELVVSADSLTVTDTITGLVWQRDGSGTRPGCSGDADRAYSANLNLTCTWSEAQDYCASLTLGGSLSWRLPAVMELSTIMDLTKTNPTIDQTAFPNTPSFAFWTSSAFPNTNSSPSSPDASSPAATGPPKYWGDFSLGDQGSMGANMYNRVRCVRGARCYPTSRFVVLSGGLVSDTLTNLVWQQQASTTTMTWAAAQTYCSSAGLGFRLPIVKELLSIVDFAVAGPAINQTAFPNTPAEVFWTSSPYAGSSGYAWLGSFNYGGAESADVSNSYRVRCVR